MIIIKVTVVIIILVIYNCTAAIRVLLLLRDPHEAPLSDISIVTPIIYKIENYSFINYEITDRTFCDHYLRYIDS